MSVIAHNQNQKMTVDEFIAWRETQEGKWELHDGLAIRRHDPAKGQSERIEHVEAKLEIVIALREAIKKAEIECHAMTDGVTIKLNDETSYIPDALVYCGDKIDGKDLTISNPIIIVEVLSPSTAWKDISEKLTNYFTLKVVQHYLIIDPVRKTITHHYREGEQMSVQVITTPSFELSPPNIIVDITELFA